MEKDCLSQTQQLTRVAHSFFFCPKQMFLIGILCNTQVYLALQIYTMGKMYVSPAIFL